MGALLSCVALPALGSIGGWVVSCFSAAACSLMFKSCNCNNSMASRIGYALIFLLNSMIAYLATTEWAIKQLQHMTYDYLQMDCEEGSCYGVVAVHRVCFALTLFHAILGVSLIGVNDSRSKRAQIQNGWWGPKILAWIALLAVCFFIPNEFFMFWGNYIALIGAAFFILFGLMLLVDFAHSWSETCLERWETAEDERWKWVLILSTLSMFIVALTLTGVMYAFFAKGGCQLNQFFISFNLVLCFIVSALCVAPAIQEANPRSGLSQSAMVVAYSTYLILSAVANEPDDQHCNPLTRSRSTRNTSLALGALFTFLAIAYSTSRAATQGRALITKSDYAPLNASVAVPLTSTMDVEAGARNAKTGKSDALYAAVESGALPASALDSDDDDDGDDAHDDERHGAVYDYAFFHFIFAVASMYIAMLLTNWTTVTENAKEENLIIVGQSYNSVWVKVVSSWVCIALYAWTLVGPVVLPDRFQDF